MSHGAEETERHNKDVEDKVIRTFSTGATRDTAQNKLDYEGFESPIVFKSYAQYLNKHRKTADGSFRDSDNWQNLFGEKHYDVCMKSMMRHMVDTWLQHRGFQGEQSLEDDLNAVIFNAKAYLFKMLTEREKKNKPCSKCDYIHLTATSPCGPQA